jgi:hypothetical protein
LVLLICRSFKGYKASVVSKDLEGNKDRLFEGTAQAFAWRTFLLLWPGFDPGSCHVGFVVDKVALGLFSPNTSVSPANHSTDCPTPIIQGWYNRPNGGQHAKLTQSHPTPRNVHYDNAINDY